MERKIITNEKRAGILQRVVQKLCLGCIRYLSHVLPQDAYMRLLTRYLVKKGMNIKGRPIYISPSCWFDPTDFSLITIEDQVVISSNVSLLTHDYSISRARDALTSRLNYPEIAIVEPIRIGRNSFIGFGSILMPGVDIGENCIVGAGSVVRGNVLDNSIMLGNPAICVGNSLEWGSKKLQKNSIE